MPVHADDSQGTLHPIHMGKKWRAKQESLRQIALSDSSLAHADSNPFSHEQASVFMSGLHSIFCPPSFANRFSTEALVCNRQKGLVIERRGAWHDGLLRGDGLSQKLEKIESDRRGLETAEPHRRNRCQASSQQVPGTNGTVVFLFCSSRSE
jgi:hypothetical protein